jgi:hypothetical protein
LHELTASQLVAKATHSDTGSHNRLDLIQSLVPTQTAKIELVDNMDETQDDKYIPSLICFARKDFSEQYLMEGRA